MNNLFIFVEGYYDQMFVENILSQFFLDEMSTLVHAIPYAQKGKKLINKEIKSKSRFDYILLADLDSNQHPCITHKKDEMVKYFTNLNSNNVIIVKEEIESWFLAGMDTSLKQFEDFTIPNKTDSITKEDFNQMLDNSHDFLKEEFLFEVCRYYDIDLAMERNSSFKYFINKVMHN